MMTLSKGLFPRKGLALVLIGALAAASGCSGSGGPPRYEVWGTVTFDGKPVPKGFIKFTPDTAQGNSGPGGGAEIKDGHYRTATGKGVSGGPHVVHIVGYDGVATSAEGEELPDGQSLFTPYQTTIDFPKEKVEHNFEIPKP